VINSAKLSGYFYRKQGKLEYKHNDGRCWCKGIKRKRQKWSMKKDNKPTVDRKVDKDN